MTCPMGRLLLEDRMLPEAMDGSRDDEGGVRDMVRGV